MIAQRRVGRSAVFCCIAGGKAALDGSARRTLGLWHGMSSIPVPPWRDRLEPSGAAAGAYRHAAQCHRSRAGGSLDRTAAPASSRCGGFERSGTRPDHGANRSRGSRSAADQRSRFARGDIAEAEGLYWPEVKSRFGETLTERWFTDDDAASPGGETGFKTRSRGLAPVCCRAAIRACRRVDPWCHGAATDEARVAARQPTLQNAQYRALYIAISGGRRPSHGSHRRTDQLIAR